MTNRVDSVTFAARVAAGPWREHMPRQASSRLYNTASVVVRACEGRVPNGETGKLLISRLVLKHRIEGVSPLYPPDSDWEHAAYAMLLDDRAGPRLHEAIELLPR